MRDGVVGVAVLWREGACGLTTDLTRLWLWLRLWLWAACAILRCLFPCAWLLIGSVIEGFGSSWLQMNADVFLKATKVDGVYDADPVKVPNAKRYERLSYRCATHIIYEYHFPAVGDVKCKQFPVGRQLRCSAASAYGSWPHVDLIPNALTSQCYRMLVPIPQPCTPTVQLNPTTPVAACAWLLLLPCC